MSKQHRNASARGKSFEKSFTKFLVDNDIPAKRVERINNYSVSDTDVKIDGFPEIHIDFKARKSFATYTLFEEYVLKRYCQSGGWGVMPVKEKNQKGCYILIEDKFFVELLKLYIKEKNNA